MMNQARVDEIKREIAQRQAFIAEHWGAMPDREIAAALGITVSAVRNEAQRRGIYGRRAGMERCA